MLEHWTGAWVTQVQISGQPLAMKPLPELEPVITFRHMPTSQGHCAYHTGSWLSPLGSLEERQDKNYQKTHHLFLDFRIQRCWYTRPRAGVNSCQRLKNWLWSEEMGRVVSQTYILCSFTSSNCEQGSWSNRPQAGKWANRQGMPLWLALPLFCIISTPSHCFVSFQAERQSLFSSKRDVASLMDGKGF